ncbi:MAG: SAM-dependent methyltransferase [Polyangiaceae bacterium]|nr:SAM-dependent methyltransferase [Polyangiaceae bacterium]
MMAPTMQRTDDKNRMDLPTAMLLAQGIAWAPLLFQAARSLRNLGILARLLDSPRDGCTLSELHQATEVSDYGLKVLLEAGMSLRMVERRPFRDEVVKGEVEPDSSSEPRYFATRVGYLIEKDELTRVNMNFSQDVCYRGAEFLEESIRQGEPAGLKELGNWPDIYHGLQALNEPAKTSWFEFDHFYSDNGFPRVLKKILGAEPVRLLDVGGNTGKFAAQVLAADDEHRVTIADLPPQVQASRQNLVPTCGSRSDFWELNILDDASVLPTGHDIIWMSQLLCCFSEEEVVKIMKKARQAMNQTTRYYVFDTFWDCQNPVAQLSLQACSLYFTAFANGKSRMYDRGTFLRLAERAGLRLQSEEHQIGWGHSLLEFSLEGGSPDDGAQD